LCSSRAGSLLLDSVRHVALDEADALLSPSTGLGGEVERLLDELANRRRAPPTQHVLTAATMSEEVLTALDKRFPHASRLSHRGVLAPTLRQRYYFVRGDKEQELLRLLETACADAWLAEGGTMIFCGGARRAERIHTLILETMPWLRPALLHGERLPEERDATLDAFGEAATQILVCTDTAARGLDLPHVRHVVMYDFPRDATTFIHRAGRTARRGQRGLLSCLVTPVNEPLYRAIRMGEQRQGTVLQASAGRRGVELDETPASAA
jgi:ATP-dependent RNA helicase DDX3X